MKLKVVCLAAIMLFIMPICAFAAEKSDFSLKLNEKKFTVVYEESNKKAAAKLLNMSEERLEEYFDENNVLLIAVNSDNSFQVRLSCYDNEFSELAEDLKLLSDDEISQLAPYLTGEDKKSEIKLSNGRKYITFSDVHNDSGGVYTATQFITVCDGDVYQFSCFNSGDKVNSDAYDIFSTLVIKDGQKESVPIWITILIVLGIAVFAALGVAMIIGIIKERKEK